MKTTEDPFYSQQTETGEKKQATQAGPRGST
eukprot:CAMPEP_0172641012 /NCGR_PEP_ID=MMETSP1068-20121228/225333_1 /TAXON_ID=35684 /ORGANISM="Pseudopedinella elastica, Strain CCMP716" /LENGTH=30 /DNA_ID= /DNA_START= /DNA_END= /DNA_ORIENTATION=